MPAENLRSYGFDVSLRDIPGPRRTFESLESNFPLPGISYYQKLNLENDRILSWQEFIDSNKRLAKASMVVGGIFIGIGFFGHPFWTVPGAGFAGIGFLYYRAFVDYERRQDPNPHG